MGGYPCGCVTSECCATTAVMRASVDFGSLAGIAQLDSTAFYGDCFATSAGSSDGTVPAAPPWLTNVIINSGSWHVQQYSRISTALNLNSGQCYRFNIVNEALGETDPAYAFQCLINSIDGEISLITGTEDSVPPYEIVVQYYLYTDQSGHCILRVAAYLYSCDRLVAQNRDTGTLGGGGAVWNYTDTSYKYSDYNPCAEDQGVLPPSEDFQILPTPKEEAGIWLNGYKRVPGSISGVSSHLGTLPQWELWDSGDLVYDSTSYSGEFAWAWEIDLTASAITDLGSLPSTVLDWTNLTGVLTGNITGNITPIGSMPSGYLDDAIEIYTPNSLGLGAATTFDDISTIVNDGAGNHICKVGDVDGETSCGTYGVFVIHRHLQNDIIQWEYRIVVESDTYTVPWKDFELTIGPKP